MLGKTFRNVPERALCLDDHDTRESLRPSTFVLIREMLEARDGYTYAADPGLGREVDWDRNRSPRNGKIDPCSAQRPPSVAGLPVLRSSATAEDGPGWQIRSLLNLLQRSKGNP